MSSGEEAKAFIEALTKSPQLKVLSVLMDKPQQELTKTEIADKAGIGRTTLYRIWSDLERMRAITPSRQVGAVTLYRLNPRSPAVQSFMRIIRSLGGVMEAVARIEEIEALEEAAKKHFGSEMPPGPRVLVKLHEVNATDRDKAVDVRELKLSSGEGEVLEALVKARLIDREAGKAYLTPLGRATAQGARRIWKGEGESLEEAIASAKVALGLIDQEIKKLKAQIQRSPP